MTLRRISWIISNFIFGLMVALVAAIGFLYVGDKVNLTTVPRAFIILSGSMEPKIKTGSIVVTVPSHFYFTGDIISFAVNGDKKDVVTHRITRIIDNESYYSISAYETKGDANNAVDMANIESKNVIGKVILTVPYVGFAADFMKKPQGFIFFVIVPATIIIYEELKSVKKELANFFKKLKKNHDDNPIQSNSAAAASKLFVIVPIVAAGLLIVVGSKSFFLDKEESLSNVFGAATVFATPTPTPVNGPSPTPTPQLATTLVINEFLWNSSCSRNNPEFFYWLELYNGSNVTVDLKDWRFTDANNNIIQISNSQTNIAPGEYLLIAKDNSTFSNCYTKPDGINQVNLGGSDDFLPETTGGIVNLEKPVGVDQFEIVDRIEYGPVLNNGLLDASTDQSVGRSHNAIDTKIGDQFAVTDFKVYLISSPGQINP